jgi:hypothetical protein
MLDEIDTYDAAGRMQEAGIDARKRRPPHERGRFCKVLLVRRTRRHFLSASLSAGSTIQGCEFRPDCYRAIDRLSLASLLDEMQRRHDAAPDAAKAA